MRTLQAQVVGNVFPIGHHHATFARRQILIREKAEAADRAPGTQSLALQRSPGRVSGILDHRQSVAIGDFQDLFHPAGIPAIMHHHDRFRLGRDLASNIFRVDGEILQTDHVGKVHLSPGI